MNRRICWPSGWPNPDLLEGDQATKLGVMPKHPKLIADQLRRAIARAEKRGVTRYQIAIKAGMPHTTLTRFVNEDRQLRLDTAEKLARALGGRLRLEM